MKRPYPAAIARRMERAPLPLSSAELRDDAIRRTIRSIPKGKVATYGQVAAAAGYPLLPRRVAAILRDFEGLPWQRVVGFSGEIKLKKDMYLEQRMRLEREGVSFRGKRVDLEKHQHQFEPWDL